MSDKLNNKEEKFKNILEDMSFDLDTDSLWSQVSTQLPKKEKKNRKFLWFLFAGTLILAFIGGALWNQTINTTKSELVKNIDNLQIDEMITPPGDHSTKEPSVEKVTPEILSNTENIVHESEKQIENGSLNNPSQKYNPEKEEIYKENQSLESNLRPIRKNIIDRKESLIVISASENDKKEDRKILTGKNIVTVSEAISISDISALDPEVSYKENALIDFDFPYAPVRTLKPVKDRRWKSFLQLQSGINSNISSYTSGEKLSAEMRNEKDRVGYSGELNYGMEHNAGWRLSAGLYYGSFFSSISKNNTETETGTVDGISDIYIDAQGVSNPLAGELTRTTSTTYDLQWHRRHKKLDLQLAIGKTIVNYKSIALGLDAGVSYNLWNQSRGFYYNEELEFTKTADGVSNPYKEKLGLAYKTSVFIEYQLGGASIGLAPYFRYNPASFTDNDHNYELKNNQLGINCSLLYKL